GKDVSEAALLHLAEKAEEFNSHILVDEVYLDFLPEDHRKPAASLHNRLVSVNSLTKVYGFGDLRSGWAIGPEELIWECWRFNNLLSAVPPVIPEAIALELMRNGGMERAGAWARRRARENLDLVSDWMNQHERLTWVEPDAGVIGAVQIRGLDDSGPFLKLLWERFKTAVMPGREFGIPDGFRMGFGEDSTEVREGLRRIDLALSEYNS
ncbi:aminotransferase class I/II-fold pyridoxal phosphate-dependent enzyme, partial [bacterium]|nr:aminotransferase class I/II-fold pyridoxal phosphate-dependent enzyme [bacterium]